MTSLPIDDYTVLRDRVANERDRGAGLMAARTEAKRQILLQSIDESRSLDDLKRCMIYMINNSI